MQRKNNIASKLKDIEYVIEQTETDETMVQASSEVRTTFTPFQIEMLEMVSRVKDQSVMNDIRRLLADYFAQRAEDEIDRLWDEGILSEEVMEEWKTEHMRTPYAQ